MTLDQQFVCMRGIQFEDHVLKEPSHDDTGAYSLLRKLSSGDMRGVEMQNRLSGAWAVFMKFNSELCRQLVSTAGSSALEALVTARVLHAAASLTITQEFETQLSVTRRRKLRMMLGAGRTCVATDSIDYEQESWFSYVRSTIHQSEAQWPALSGEDWRIQQRRTNWRLARRPLLVKIIVGLRDCSHRAL